MKIFIVLTYIIAWPISILLDRVLGRDIGQVFSAAELHKLIRVHVENPDAQLESGLNKEDGNLLTGALEYKDKKVADVMTTLDKVFMVESSTRLTFQVLLDIYKSGFTRIRCTDRPPEHHRHLVHERSDPDRPRRRGGDCGGSLVPRQPRGGFRARGFGRHEPG